jgi:small subunit ribosomal protein S16
MLVIRMQRTGRKGHAMFRMVVQDSRRTPTSGKVVAQLGSYDPHAKTVTLQKDKTSFYLEHGAQPSERVVKLLTGEGIQLPAWVKKSTTKQAVTRKPDKLRKNQPAQEAAPKKSTEKAPEETEPPTEATAVTAEQAPATSADSETAKETVAASSPPEVQAPEASKAESAAVAEDQPKDSQKK